MKKLLFVLLFLVGFSFSDFCYQETANVSTACGGLNTGTYNFTGSWDGTQIANLTYDADYGTYGRGSNDDIGNVFINYTKPNNSINSSVWQIKNEDELANKTIPNNCFIQTPLQFKIISNSDVIGSANTTWQCWNGSAMETVASTANPKSQVYEEAMYWNISGTNVDNCQELSTANEDYTLTGDMPVNASTCFNITAENITLDCGGYLLIGDNSSSHYGIYSDQFNTTVKNCDISNFSAGIFIDGEDADYANITNNTINITYSTSPSYTVGPAIAIANADYSNITNNYLYAYRYTLAFSANSNDNHVSLNNITATGIRGISLASGSTINTIEYNNISSAYFNSANNNIFVDNDLVGTIQITDSEYNEIKDNRLVDVILDAGSLGNIIETNNLTHTSNTISLVGADLNIISNNIIYSSSTSSITGVIKFTSTADSNNITNNTIYSTASGSSEAIGIRIYDGINNIIKNNTINIVSSNTPGIQVTFTSTNNTFLDNNITANIWVDDDGLADNTNFYNDSDSGNIYYFANGIASWDVYDIIASSGDWADGGTDVPLNASLTEWLGFGNDSHPWAGGATIVVGTRPYIWDGTNWVEYNGANTIDFRCEISVSGFPIWCQSTNQDNTTAQPIFRIQNNGTSVSSWQAIQTNATWGTQATLYCGTNTNPLIDSVNLTTTLTNYTENELAVGYNNSLYCFFRISRIDADFQRNFNVSFENG